MILVALLIFGTAACGKQQAPYDEPKQEHEMEDAADSEDKIVEEEAAEEERTSGVAIEDTGMKTEEPEEMQTGMNPVITAYVTEEIEYSEEVIPIRYVDDLSLLDGLKYTNSAYVYQDGNVYYRRYHGDSYTESAVWGNYIPIPETKKEIVCIDSAGMETELFADEGYGDIYLVNNRFYMTDGKLNSETHMGLQLYSVDMQGNDRIDYGNGRILVIDSERNVMILQMYEVEEERYWDLDNYRYYIMNYETGEKRQINLNGSHIVVKAYQDGWIYYTKQNDVDDDVSRLCAISLEGEQRDIIALATDIELLTYPGDIWHTEVDGDRIYFDFGGTDGSLSIFYGFLISVKLDGTDYRAVKTADDFFYISHNNGKTLVYYPRYNSPAEVDSYAEYDMFVWDVDADRCDFTDFPQRVLYDLPARSLWQYYPADRGGLCEWSVYGDHPQTNIYALPDDSGRFVRVVMGLEDYIIKREEVNDYLIKYKDWYYADGFLYFTVEYNDFDEEASIGWRDGYRRLQSDVYRLKVGEHAARLLYSY